MVDWSTRAKDFPHLRSLRCRPGRQPAVQITTWQDLIARYQEKFMPAAAGVYSRPEYNIAKQISSEDVGGWHARLRDLYNIAYPGKEVDNNLPLIEKFVTQLINKEVGKFVFERNPATFAGALALAKTKTATDVTFKTASHSNSSNSPSGGREVPRCILSLFSLIFFMGRAQELCFCRVSVLRARLFDGLYVWIS
jgi:hypothetical protein